MEITTSITWIVIILIATLWHAALAPEASAYLPEGTVERVGAMYKVSAVRN
jgi:hypothetical protein